MKKRYLLVPLLLANSYGFAQMSPLVKLNQNYQSGLELLHNEKFVAAAQQFKMVEQYSNKTSTQQLSTIHT